MSWLFASSRMLKLADPSLVPKADLSLISNPFELHPDNGMYLSFSYTSTFLVTLSFIKLFFAGKKVWWPPLTFLWRYTSDSQWCTVSSIDSSWLEDNLVNWPKFQQWILHEIETKFFIFNTSPDLGTLFSNGETTKTIRERERV